MCACSRVQVPHAEFDIINVDMRIARSCVVNCVVERHPLFLAVAEALDTGESDVAPLIDCPAERSNDIYYKRVTGYHDTWRRLTAVHGALGQAGQTIGDS